MKNTLITLLLGLSGTCMGFDVKSFADDYDHHDYAKDVSCAISQLQSGSEVTDDRLIAELLNYHAVTSLSEVSYSIRLQDVTFFYGQKLFSDSERKAIEGDVRRNVTSAFAKYGVNEAVQKTSDVPLIDIEIRTSNDPQVDKTVRIETKLRVKRSLLDPATRRAIVAIVWTEHWTRVCTTQSPYFFHTEHADLADKILHDAETLVFLLSWSQYRSITTMEAAVQLKKEGNLPERFSDYVLK